jgi:protein-S-isoprenylcysteine O-methyltransferase Ste14
MAVTSKHGGANVRFPPPLVFVLLLGAGAALQRWVFRVDVPIPTWPRIVAGVLVALCGVSSIAAARVWFSRTGQSPVPWKPSPELLVQGIFRYTRNPMYVGMTLITLGVGVALGNVFIVAFAPLALTIIHFIAVRPEEAYLTDKFGESYVRYMSTVRRYL